jgi:hypothetical protein
LCVCCLYVVNILAPLLTTYNLSHTVNFAWRIQNTSSTIIDNIFVDNTVANLCSISPILKGLSDHDVFVRAHYQPIWLEWGTSNVKFFFLKILSYTTLVQWQFQTDFICLIHARTKYTKESVHTLVRNVMLSGRYYLIQNKPQIIFVTLNKEF